MFFIDNQDIQKLEDDLRRFKARAVPFATRSTLNSATFAAMKFAQGNIRTSMITRNQYTVQSVQVEKSRTLHIRSQAATVGSTLDYMETQEFGGRQTSRGKHGVPIPTAVAAGLPRGTNPIRQLPREDKTRRAIQLSKRHRKGVSAKQRNFLAIRAASKRDEGQRDLYLELGRTKGLFRVTGSKLNLLWDLSRRSVVIPATPWLGPAVGSAVAEIPEIYTDALRFQLRRHGLFDGR